MLPPPYPQFNQGTCGLSPNVKVHTLIAKGGTEMRIVMVKKSGDQPIIFNVTIKGGESAGTVRRDAGRMEGCVLQGISREERRRKVKGGGGKERDKDR